MRLVKAAGALPHARKVTPGGALPQERYPSLSIAFYAC